MTTKKEQRDTVRAQGRIYTLRDLPLKGISFSSVHLHRLIRAGKFPPPFYMSERRPAWTEATLDLWIAEREAERDASITA